MWLLALGLCDRGDNIYSLIIMVTQKSIFGSAADTAQSKKRPTRDYDGTQMARYGDTLATPFPNHLSMALQWYKWELVFL